MLHSHSQLMWYLSHVVPPALSDMAILIQDALYALSTSTSSSTSSDYSLPVSSDIHDPISVKGSISINVYTITRSNIDIKFPSRSSIHLTMDQCKLHPIMEAHHFVSMVLSTLQSTLPPFTFHTVHALTSHISSCLQSALTHVRHNHRTIGPYQFHPYATSIDQLLGIATAIGGDHLVISFASLNPIPIHRNPLISNNNITTTTTDISSSVSTPPTNSSNNKDLLVPFAFHHGRNPSVSSVNSITRSNSPFINSKLSSSPSTPPPSLYQSSNHHSIINPGTTTTTTSSSNNSPLAEAKLKASHSIRSALSSVVGGIHHTHYDNNNTITTSSSSPLSISDILHHHHPNTTTGTMSKPVYLLGNAWHEVLSETSIEIGWKPLVEFRDKLAAALALNNHIAAQISAFTQTVDMYSNGIPVHNANT